MKGSRHIWVIFAAGLLVVLGAMGWVTAVGLRLEEERAAARHSAAREEKVRLALWRMDSALASLYATENTRPYFAYSAFYPAGRAYTRMFSEIRPGEILIPSPLLTSEPEPILLHFQIDPTGEIRSPQAPTGNRRDLAEGEFVPAGRIETMGARLTDLSARIRGEDLVAELEKKRSPGQPEPEITEQVVRAGSRAHAQQAFNVAEMQARNRQMEQVVQQKAVRRPVSPSSSVREGPLHPLWRGDMLLFARLVQVNGKSYVQGAWLDWDGLSGRLTESVRDLLPGARLERVSDGENGAARRLASLPARIVPGEIVPPEGTLLSPVRLSLGIAWACVLAAVLAVGVVLGRVVSLSERRAAFVSAVTHELRTPLTTFRMYSEMLADGMVEDPDQRTSYLETLRSQAHRLSHLVENVLAFARLEKGRAGHRAEKIVLPDLIERVAAPLQEHATRSGAQLEVRVTPEAEDLTVRAAPSAVEHILFNLIDNACKYGSEGGPIELTADAGEAGAVVSVRDHGPGILPEQAEKIFLPFHKSAADAANSAPGVGLGLALSRRLAREQGGDLTLRETGGDGACFALRLPPG